MSNKLTLIPYPEKLKIGDTVKTSYQLGKNGIATEVTGIIRNFNSIIFIEGEPTATIIYDNTKEKGCHKISSLIKIT
ncbi:MAG: hypothetical protein AABY22_31700 [Nanoarchaeota archaeon]